MTHAMEVVLRKASGRNLKTEVCDRRRLYIDNRTCQSMRTKWSEDYPGCSYLNVFMPQNDFADFLLYVPEGQDVVYVVPRGKIAYATRWSKAVLEPYKEAWHLLKETAPALFERRDEALSVHLRRVIEEAEKRSLPYQLIPSKPAKGKPERQAHKQRRIVMKGRRCAIFMASLFLPKPDHSQEAALFRTTTDAWPEIFLYILGKDIYVVPRTQVPHEMSSSLRSLPFRDFKNAWCVLDGVDPTSSKQQDEMES